MKEIEIIIKSKKVMNILFLNLKKLDLHYYDKKICHLIIIIIIKILKYIINKTN
jgi:hypothetical protein